MDKYKDQNSYIDDKCYISMWNRFKNHNTDVYPFQEVSLGKAIYIRLGD